MKYGGALILFFGRPGGGKSYSAVQWIDEQMRSDAEFRVITNLPLHLEFFDRSRVRLIERERFLQWIESGEGRKQSDPCADAVGPWDYDDEMDVSGWVFILDEVHHLASSTQRIGYRKRFREWVQEIRHRGASCVCITQSEEMICSKLMTNASHKFEIVNVGAERDRLLRIKKQSIHDLKSAIYRWPHVVIRRIEYAWVGHWEEQDRRDYVCRDSVFRMYESRNAPVRGGNAAGAEKLMTPRQALKMLVWDNWPYFVPRLAVAIAVLVFFAFMVNGGHKAVWSWLRGGTVEAAVKPPTAHLSSRPKEPVKPVSFGAVFGAVEPETAVSEGEADRMSLLESWYAVRGVTLHECPDEALGFKNERMVRLNGYSVKRIGADVWISQGSKPRLTLGPLSAKTTAMKGAGHAGQASGNGPARHVGAADIGRGVTETRRPPRYEPMAQRTDNRLPGEESKVVAP